MGRTWLRGLAAAAAVSGLLALSACGSDDPGEPVDEGGPGAADPGADPASDGATVTVTFDVSGGATINGKVTLPAPSVGLEPPSCAAYAAGLKQPDGGTLYPVPSLVQAGPVGGHQVTVEAIVEGYTGPGTYGADQLSGLGSGANILVDNQQQYELLHDVTDSQLVADDSGGGAWTFTNLVARSDSSKPGINGTISWTCDG